MTDGFKMKVPPAPKTDREMYGRLNSKRLREITRRYIKRVDESANIASAIEFKAGAAANVMTTTENKVVVANCQKKGGLIGIPHTVYQSCFNHQAPLIVFVDNVSERIEWAFYKFDASQILLDPRTTQDDNNTVWFSWKLGTNIEEEETEECKT